MIHLIFLLLFTPFKSQSSEIKGVAFKYRNHTLNSSFKFCEELPNKSYFKIINESISCDFVLIDSLKVDLNRDGKGDYIFIFSPKIQEDDNYELSCYKSKSNKRILMSIFSTKFGYKVHSINENLILNRGDYPSEPYKGIKIIKNGFKILFSTGTSVKCEYEFMFEYLVNDIYVVEKVSNCYKINLSSFKKNRIKYNAGPISINNFILKENL